MSALPIEPTPSTPAAPAGIERRRRRRHTFLHRHRVVAGRGEGTIRDLSRGGMKIRHNGTLLRGAQVRVAFEWREHRFAATAEVLASRVVSLGGSEDGSTLYESRLKFVRMSRTSYDVLVRLLSAVSGTADA